ncbi:hypothetical protein ABZ917_37525 [Nonomuraea wenchangensis]
MTKRRRLLVVAAAGGIVLAGLGGTAVGSTVDDPSSGKAINCATSDGRTFTIQPDASGKVQVLFGTPDANATPDVTHGQDQSTTPQDGPAEQGAPPKDGETVENLVGTPAPDAQPEVRHGEKQSTTRNGESGLDTAPADAPGQALIKQGTEPEDEGKEVFTVNCG